MRHSFVADEIWGDTLEPARVIAQPLYNSSGSCSCNRHFFPVSFPVYYNQVNQVPKGVTAAVRGMW